MESIYDSLRIKSSKLSAAASEGGGETTSITVNGCIIPNESLYHMLKYKLRKKNLSGSTSGVKAVLDFLWKPSEEEEEEKAGKSNIGKSNIDPSDNDTITPLADGSPEFGHIGI